MTHSKRRARAVRDTERIERSSMTELEHEQFDAKMLALAIGDRAVAQRDREVADVRLRTNSATLRPGFFNTLKDQQNEAEARVDKADKQIDRLTALIEARALEKAR